MDMNTVKNTPKLGFGLMRLPRGTDGKYDVPQCEEMIDRFLGAGMTYFDTAFVYDEGQSELLAGKALVARHDREEFTLATKLNVRVAENAEEAKSQFWTSLERTGAGYFDYYLLHAVQKNRLPTYDGWKIWDFAREQKEKGLVKHWGFSFHDSPQVLDQILTDHPDVDFVQLQINYADWDSPTVASRANYEVARKHHKPVVIMEPVKGGALALPPAPVQKVFDDTGIKASYASWALRFAASLEGVLTVLSGMSTLGQMEDNLSFMTDFQPLTPAEREVVDRARAALRSVPSIPCTGCEYCVAGCPKSIPIPRIFSARNQQLIWGQTQQGRAAYAEAVKDKGKASDCIGCGQCEGACPQMLPIIRHLKDCAEALE